MPGAGAHPAFFTDHDRHRLVNDLHFQHSPFLGLDEGAPCVGKCFGVSLNLLDHQAFECSRAAQNLFQLFLLITQLFELLLNLDGLQSGQLPQPDFKNVLSLPVTQFEARNQRRFGFIRLADDGNDFIDVEQHNLPPLQNVYAVQHLVQAMLRAALDGDLAKLDPLHQHLTQ